jgi:hypothetical protein
MTPIYRRLILALFASSAFTLLLGCATGVMPGPAEMPLKFQIAGGGTADVTFNNNGPVHPENDDIKIEKTLLGSGLKPGQCAYKFSLVVKGRETLRKVIVDDVSDEAPVKLAEDGKPATVDGHWKRLSEDFEPSPVSLRWLFELGNCFRIYRFTIEMGDGRKLVMYDPCFYPVPLKQLYLYELRLVPDKGGPVPP